MTEIKELHATSYQEVTTMRQPPKNLGKVGLELWNKFLSEYDLNPVGELLLAQACKTADVAASIAAALERDGMNERLVRQQLAAHALISRLIARLVPPRDKRPIGRPPTPYGWPGPRPPGGGCKPWEDDD
jgi:hypothetical protein